MISVCIQWPRRFPARTGVCWMLVALLPLFVGGCPDTSAPNDPSGDGDQGTPIADELAAFKNNPTQAKLLALTIGEPVALSAPTDPTAADLDCKAAWSVDGSGTFADVSKITTVYFPADNDTMITVVVTCAGVSETIRQSVGFAGGS